MIKCYECDGLGFQEEAELEDVEIYRHDSGFIYKVERYSNKYDVDLSIFATAFGFYGNHWESWVLCSACDGWGKE